MSPLSSDGSAEPAPGLRDGADQPPGVRVRRLGPYPFGGAALDDPAEVHHDRAVSDLAHYRQVVRDEEHPEPGLGHDPGQEVGDLRLRRCIEGTYGLVRHHAARFCSQYACDGDPLALTARELMRVPVADGGSQADSLEELADASDRGRVVDFGPSAQPYRIGDLASHAAPRVEGRVRVLEHHLE